MNVGSLDASTSLDTSGLKSGADQGKSIISGLLGAFESFGKAALSPMSLVTSGLGGLVDGLGKVGLAAMGLKAVGETAVSMASGLLKGNAALEMTTISFKTLLGSTEAANDMIKQLTSFAASTPFELAGLEASTQKLLAFGFSSKEIIPLMTSMGDAISALGGTQDNLNSLVYVMGQMRGEAHLNAGDIMQMTNLGIPALQMLADHYKVTTGVMQEMISKGLVPGKEAVDIFTNGLEQKYGGMMAAQSATFSGMISNLQDWASSTTIILTKPFFEPAKKALGEFLAFVQSPAGVAAIKKLADDIQHGVDLIMVGFGRLRDFYKTFISAWNGDWEDAPGKIRTLDRVVGIAATNMGKAFDTLKKLVGLAVDKFNDARPAIENFIRKVEPIVSTVLQLYQAFSPLNIALDVFKGFLSGGVQGALDAFGLHMSKAGDLIGDLIPKILTALSEAIPKVLDWITEQAPKILDQLGKWADSFGKLVDKVLPPLLQALTTIGEKVLTWIVDKAPDVLNKLGEWAGKFGEFAKKAIPILLDKLGDLITALLNWLGDKAPDILSALGEWTGKLIEWGAQLFTRLFPELLKFANKLWTWIGEQAPTLADKVSEWAGSFLNWIVTQAIPGWIQLAPKIWIAILEFIGKVALNIVIAIAQWAGAFLGWVWDVVSKIGTTLFNIWLAVETWILGRVVDIVGALAGWVGAFLGFVWNVVSGLPGALWNIITGIASWIANMAGTIASTAVDIGKNILKGIADGIMAAPGIIWDALKGILGGAWDIVKHVIPGGVPAGYAMGTDFAPGGLAMVGEGGLPELLKFPGGKQSVATMPTLLDLPRGSQVIPLRAGSGGGAGSLGGNQYTINQHFHITGQADQATIAAFKRVAKQAVQDGLGELKTQVQDNRSRTRSM